MSQLLTFDLNVDNKQAIDSINAFFQVYEKGVDGMSKMMSDALGQTVEKKVKISMDGDKLIAKEVEVVSKEVKAIEVAAKAMNGEFGKTPNALRRQLKVLKAIQGDTKKYNDQTGKVTGTWKRLQEVITKVQQQIQKMGEGGGMASFTDKLTSSQIAADSLMGTFNMLKNAVTGFVNTGMDMEVLFIQLQGFTGGVQQAADAYKEFVAIGQSTPFTAKQVASAARTMMGFGIETSQAVDQVRRLAIVASATGGELTHMARNLGQIQANQRAYTRDLMQFANQGIPIYQKIAEILGVTTQQVREMAEEGEIGFTEVSAALREMTKEGTAFQLIADKMDRTFAAKIEGIQSSIESLAGNFLAMISEFDNAIGGPLAGILQLVMDIFNGIAGEFGKLSANMKKAAPLVAALATAFATLVGLTIAQNWAAFSAAMMTMLKVTKLWTLAEWAWNTAKAVGNALLGNWVSIAGAAAAAAGIAAMAVAANSEALDEQNAALEAGKALQDGDIKSREQQAFATDGLTASLREYIKAKKEEYDAAREGQDIAKKRAQMAVQWQKQQLEAFKESQKEEREMLKDRYKEERELHKETSAAIKEDYKERIGKENEILEKIRERHALEMDKLGEKSDAEKQLEAYRRQELEWKAKGIKFTESEARLKHKERLEAQASLDRMDKRLKKEELSKQHAKEIADQKAKIKRLEEDKEQAIAAEKKRHEAEIKHIKDEEKALDEKLEEEQRKVDAMESKYNSFFNNLDDARYSDHKQAMQDLDDQIAKWGQLEQKAITALRNIEAERKRGKTGDDKAIAEGGYLENGAYVPKFASGGPISGGTVAQVNELGKEAFLSASGRLSMIKAPSYGLWKAPSNGTIIPAHLTSQLDIPAGGININSVPSVRSFRGGGSVAQGGDNISNTVTVQSMNPGKTASDMLVALTKVRRRRLG